ncbi:hypothetical protein F511_41859 [Dorcoceras hygrometricum]|uniref:Uncharacterized protein n=1 Tax=Dorcoceras hygrometricum TaxID=472368 RepID=A0A2Z7AJH5_9LAMI|nr:hypothetical protein F511_41859 [Dorcoceras hygrometricum]
MTFRVVRTNQYNQDLGLIHSTNGNHLESPNEGCSIDHQVTIYLHAQNITMFPINETWYFTSQILVSNSGGLILILTAQSTRNMFRIHGNRSSRPANQLAVISIEPLYPYSVSNGEIIEERMGKAAMLKALQEETEGGSSGVAAPSEKVAKKRKASTPDENEARRQKKKGALISETRPAPTKERHRAPTPLVQTREERREPMPVIVIPELSSPRRGPMTGMGPGRVPALNLLRIPWLSPRSGPWPRGSFATWSRIGTSVDCGRPPTPKLWAYSRPNSHRYIPYLPDL